MKWMNKPLIVDSLRELSDLATQRRLWLSKGDGEVSSFTEAVESLFTDSGLESELQKRRTGFGSAAEDALTKLQVALRKVDRKLPPDRIIDSEPMENVRQLASVALGLIDATPR